MRCTQISCPLRSWIFGLVHVRRLEEANKEEKELVDVAPDWGESRISCVDVLCAMLFVVLIVMFS